MSNKNQNVKWVDGLRGIGSLLVVFTHLSRAFDEDLFKPTSSPGSPPRILQYPILRILFQGRIGVAIFSLVGGYVCALKPIRQIRSGNPPAAFTTISKSAFRRVPRLVLPSTLATFIIWLLCLLNVFEAGNQIDSWWVNYTSPSMNATFGEAVESLIYHITTTWIKPFGLNIYDMNQWTLLPLLKGSMYVYIMLVATAFCKDRYRMMIEFALVVYFYLGNDPAFGMQFFFGVFLADISQHPPHTTYLTTHTWPSRLLSPILLLFGLFLASYPETHPEWSPWSHNLLNLSPYIFPTQSEVPRYYTSLGLSLLTLGIYFSPPLKTLLSTPHLLWLGKNSFAVYLIHGTLLRSVLVWMLYGISLPSNIISSEEGIIEPGEKLKMGGKGRWYFWLPVWFGVLYWLAGLWTRWVDPACAKVMERFVGYVYEGVESEGVESEGGCENGEKGLGGGLSK